MESTFKERPISSYDHMTMADFFSKNTNIVQEGQEFIVDGGVTANDLKNLLNFKNEFALTEIQGRLIISAGSIGYAGNTEELRDRRYHSKFSGHTHSLRTDVVYDFVSDADIDSAGFGDLIPLILIHQKGIILYQKPTVDPETGKPTDGYANDLLTDYLNKKGIARMRNTLKYYPKMKLINDLPFDEKKELVKEFARKTNMILKEAKWEETEKINDLLEIINLKN